MSKKLIFNSHLLTLVLAISATAMGQQRRNFQSQANSQRGVNRRAAAQPHNPMRATVFRSARD